MSKIITSYEQVTRAYNKVRKELINLGVLWDGSKLDEVECYHERFSLGALYGLVGVMGFYEFKDRNIHIPMAYPAGLFPRWFGERQMLDVLRHEFGHALADRYPAASKKGALFRKAFGGAYGDKLAKGTNSRDWEGRCVSAYAATATQEDFAETFMFFVKHKGKMPAKFARHPAIAGKWKAVSEIIRRVAAETK